jgi:hypothetical protein
MARDVGFASGILGTIWAFGGISSFIGAVTTDAVIKRFGIGPAMIAACLVSGLAMTFVSIGPRSNAYRGAATDSPTAFRRCDRDNLSNQSSQLATGHHAGTIAGPGERECGVPWARGHDCRIAPRWSFGRDSRGGGGCSFSAPLGRCFPPSGWCFHHSAACAPHRNSGVINTDFTDYAD